MEPLDILIAKDAIRDLAGAYSMAVDDHDIESVLEMYAPDATFTIAGKTLTGHEELRAFYVDSMDRYTTMLHTPEIHLITLDDPRHAAGRMTGHAELAVRDTLMMSAFRYTDRYVMTDRWRFQHRRVRFMYAVPFEAMGASFRTDQRIRWPQTRYAGADYPESAPTWSTYRDR
ncbi:nuclear transport factor 2 family protein [Rhodococcus sp. 14-1411-2a]|uniref:nuclear transport factor 2 family protein n=1 Tax=Rhodococcus sp. 14-1411-2a TaxID=2023151 RepID=UPI000B9BC64F|nr:MULTISPECIES: nuclear transport factor 2 family protein [unclassified Rhodococcus (in: high G+C Gram-positive bacteria)]MDI6630067.1 nuclear transport factor 2 family protein [Rhodococcus sp. (in: high G+C Gram-positive bacteria)]OZF46637.1 hypothetical protein CH291_13810 [Rhodococcus sp. 14-1411-2a]